MVARRNRLTLGSVALGVGVVVVLTACSEARDAARNDLGAATTAATTLPTTEVATTATPETTTPATTATPETTTPATTAGPTTTLASPAGKWNLTSLCRPAAGQGEFRITNRSDPGTQWELVRNGGGGAFTGSTPTGQTSTQRVPFTGSGDTWLLRVRGVQVSVKAVGNNYCSQTTLQFFQQQWALDGGVWVDQGYRPVDASIDPGVRLTTDPALSNANDRPLQVTVSLTAGSYQRFEVRSLQLGIDAKLDGSGPYTQVASLPANTTQANVTANLFYPTPRPPDPTTTVPPPTEVAPTTAPAPTAPGATSTAPATTLPVVPTSAAPTTNPEQATTTAGGGSVTSPGSTGPAPTTPATTGGAGATAAPTSADPAATTTSIPTTGASTDRTVTAGALVALAGVVLLLLAGRRRPGVEG